MCYVTFSTSNSEVASIFISTHMFLQYLSSDPHAYVSRVPPGTLRVIQPRAPFRIPLVMQHPLHGGHDTLRLHGDPWSAMNDQ